MAVKSSWATFCSQPQRRVRRLLMTNNLRSRSLRPTPPPLLQNGKSGPPSKSLRVPSPARGQIRYDHRERERRVSGRAASTQLSTRRTARSAAGPQTSSATLMCVYHALTPKYQFMTSQNKCWIASPGQILLRIFSNSRCAK